MPTVELLKRISLKAMAACSMAAMPLQSKVQYMRCWPGCHRCSSKWHTWRSEMPVSLGILPLAIRQGRSKHRKRPVLFPVVRDTAPLQLQEVTGRRALLQWHAAKQGYRAWARRAADCIWIAEAYKLCRCIL